MTIPHHVNNRIDLSQPSDDILCVNISGLWQTANGYEDINAIQEALAKNIKIKKILFKVDKLEAWDTSLIAFLVNCQELCYRKKIDFDVHELSSDIQELLFLCNRVPEKQEAPPHRVSFLNTLGNIVIDFFIGCRDLFQFLGELVLSLGRLITGRGQTRWKDFNLLIQQTGAEALPIISLINFLVGFIMAFVGFTQLKKFGATIYVADLVGLATVREMGVMMTGVIMCGRTGAAFAATIGSMKVGEEIDALRTTGISPFDFLVTPRVLALLVMMPMLCLYADFIGIVGGMMVTSSFSDITLIEYWRETQDTLTMKHISVGLYKSLVFGVLIALTGCLRGIQCGFSSSAVGDAATSAVVTGITSLVVADAIFAVLFDALNI